MRRVTTLRSKQNRLTSVPLDKILPQDTTVATEQIPKSSVERTLLTSVKGFLA